MTLNQGCPPGGLGGEEMSNQIAPDPRLLQPAPRPGPSLTQALLRAQSITRVESMVKHKKEPGREERQGTIRGCSFAAAFECAAAAAWGTQWQLLFVGWKDATFLPATFLPRRPRGASGKCDR